LATEESSTTMKVAIITDTAIIHGFAAGFHSACSPSVFVGTLTSVLTRPSLDIVSPGRRWQP
jgi:hypothetical protein